MRHVSRTLCVGLTSFALTPLAASAAFTPLDSASFSKKFEMNDSDATLFGISDNTDEWTNFRSGSYSASQGASGTPTPNHLNYTTSAGLGSAFYWESNTYPAASSSTTGATWEASIKINSSDDGAETTNKAFGVVFGTEAGYANIEIGTTGIYFNGTQIATAEPIDNTDGFHVYRVARDATTGLHSLWRDGVNLANDLSTIAASLDTLYWGDGTSGWNGSVTIDYFRWDVGGYSPIPEPATGVAALALGAMVLRRRRA